MKQIPVEKKVSGSNSCPETMVMEIIGYALVDDKHYAELNQYIWTLGSGDYPKRSERIGKNSKKNIFIYNDIWCRLEGHPYTQLDHIDRNKLNNQLNNLRPANNSQNKANAGLNVNSTTRLKGVWIDRYYYRASISINGKRTHLGYFYTALEAAKVYDAAAIKYFGEFAVTNQSLGLILLP